MDTSCKLRNTSKGKLVYNNNLISLNDPNEVKKCIDDWILYPKITVPKKNAANSDINTTSQWTKYRSVTEADKSKNERDKLCINRESSSEIVSIDCISNSTQPSQVTVLSARLQYVMSKQLVSEENLIHKYLKSKTDINLFNQELRSTHSILMKNHLKRFSDHNELLDERIHAQIENLKLFESSYQQRKNLEVAAYNEKDAIDLAKKLETLKGIHQNRQDVVAGKVKEVETRKSIMQEKARLEKLEECKRFEKLTACMKTVTSVCASILSTLEGCPFHQYLPESCHKLPDLVGMINEKAECIIISAQKDGANESHLSKMRTLFEETNTVSNLLTTKMNDASQLAEDSAKNAITGTKEDSKNTPDMEKSLNQEHLPNNLDLCVTLDGYNEYTKLISKLENTEKRLEPFLQDSALCKLRFLLQKAINISLNTISASSGHHIRDKLHRIQCLFNGQSMNVGNQLVTTKNNPLAIEYCKYLFARMIVKKGDEQVSSKHETAFPIAMVTVAVCSQYLDVRELLVANFYRHCPYLVPYYITRENGDSEEQYLRKCGYKFENGKVERQDKFLKRISGYMYLYTSLMVTHPPPGYRRTFDIQNAWVWLSRTLNMTPESDVTVTLMYTLLKVCGSSLFTAYRKQFSKLLLALLHDFMKKIESVVISGGPVSRLRVFLEDCVRTGKIPNPHGYIQPNFWNT